jgi:hypothetical protein
MNLSKLLIIEASAPIFPVATDAVLSILECDFSASLKDHVLEQLWFVGLADIHQFPGRADKIVVQFHQLAKDLDQPRFTCEYWPVHVPRDDPR